MGKPTHRIFSTYGNPNMTGAWFGSMILIAMFLKEGHSDKTENKNDNIENQKTINENIIKLYKEGFSKEEISKKLNCAITEIDIVIDMENIKK